MNQDDFEAKFLRPRIDEPHRKRRFRKLFQHWNSSSFFRSLRSFMPILEWLPKYKWRRDLHGDIIGGLTVGIMHVPQGMAYASLASLPPVYGLYSSFFASSIYALFGTSRHISIGVFAVVSMMVGAVRLRLIPDNGAASNMPNATLNTDESMLEAASTLDPPITPIMLTSSLTLAVGLVLLVMAIFRLGFLTTYLSDSLVSGFTTGSACHVFTAQLNKITGVKLSRYEGTGMLFFMIRDWIAAFPKANFFTFGLSLFGLIFLKIGKDFINPMVRKRSPVPVPIDLILVIVATAFSATLDFEKTFRVSVVNHVPQGVPWPTIPKIELLPDLIGDAIAIAVVCYMFVISMAKLFAKKRKYKIDPGQVKFA